MLLRGLVLNVFGSQDERQQDEAGAQGKQGIITSQADRSCVACVSSAWVYRTTCTQSWLRSTRAYLVRAFCFQRKRCYLYILGTS